MSPLRSEMKAAWEAEEAYCKSSSRPANFIHTTRFRLGESTAFIGIETRRDRFGVVIDVSDVSNLGWRECQCLGAAMTAAQSGESLDMQNFRLKMNTVGEKVWKR